MYAKRPDAVRIRGASEAEAKMKPWEEVKKQWDDVAMIKAVCEQRSPALAMLGQEGDPGKVAEADLSTARRDVGKGSRALIDRIEKAVPLVGSEIEYEDLVPIHQQLFAGAPGVSGTNWSLPLEQTVAKHHLKQGEISRLLMALGLGALSAAAFILAPFTSGASLAFLLAVGVDATGTQAYLSWDRYSKLTTAQEATGISPRLAIVSKEQADSALCKPGPRCRSRSPSSRRSRRSGRCPPRSSRSSASGRASS